MSDPFVAEIRIAGFNFPPKGWSFCNGQLLPISQNTALFSLLGTTYGGDGKSTYGLPDMQGRAPMHQGQGPGLTDRLLGDSLGQTEVTLITSEMPAHTHQLNGTTATGSQTTIAGALPAQPNANVRFTRMYNSPDTATLDGTTLSTAGGSQPHNNMQPYLGLNFIIAMQGVFPSRG